MTDESLSDNLFMKQTWVLCAFMLTIKQCYFCPPLTLFAVTVYTCIYFFLFVCFFPKHHLTRMIRNGLHLILFLFQVYTLQVLKQHILMIKVND